MQHYTAAQSTEALPQWHCTNDHITRSFEFPDFSQCFAFITRVALLAEAAKHHPRITTEYNKLSLQLCTHDAQAVTSKDIQLAQQIDAL